MNTRNSFRLIAIALVPALLAVLWLLSSPADAEGDYTTTTIESTTTTTAPVPQALVNVEASTVCIGGTAMVIVTISNDSPVTISIDISVGDEARGGITIPPGEAINPEFALGNSSTDGGSVSVTVTYNDGGIGIFNPEPAFFEAIDCPTPVEIGDALVVERSDAYVSPPSTVPAPISPKPLSLAG